VIEFNIIGALLDPFQGNLTDFQDFLVVQNTTAFHLLFQAMDKHTGVQQLQANNNLNGMNEAASTCEFAQSPVPWKKTKKTCCRNMSILKDTGDREIKLYRCLSIAHDDVLAWWKSQMISNPGCHCSPKQYWPFQLYLCPIERIFFTAGLTVNAMRSSLAPLTVHRVVFIHENAHFFNDSFE